MYTILDQGLVVFETLNIFGTGSSCNSGDGLVLICLACLESLH